MKVRNGMVLVYDPVLWDILDPKTTLKKGDKCRVVALHGCPPPNTMGHCHVESLDGKFLGLVHTNSLRKVDK